MLQHQHFWVGRVGQWPALSYTLLDVPIQFYSATFYKKLNIFKYVIYVCMDDIQNRFKKVWNVHLYCTQLLIPLPAKLSAVIYWLILYVGFDIFGLPVDLFYSGLFSLSWLALNIHLCHLNYLNALPHCMLEPTRGSSSHSPGISILNSFLPVICLLQTISIFLPPLSLW